MILYRMTELMRNRWKIQKNFPTNEKAAILTVEVKILKRRGTPPFPVFQEAAPGETELLKIWDVSYI